MHGTYISYLKSFDMNQLRRLLVIIHIITCVLQTQGTDKYTDENRPYEFGFSIDGEQHRHEKKDENGIIMGEFGFVTADGVYHVTVYATDENGNFKILSMKNLRVPFPPGSSEKKGHSLPFPPSQNQPQTQGPKQQPKPISLEPPTKSCSSCSIPTTSTKAPMLTDIAVVAKDQGSSGNYGTNEPQYQQGGQGQQNYAQGGQNYPQGPASLGAPSNYPQIGPDRNYPANEPQDYPQAGAGDGLGAQYPQSSQASYGSTSGDRNPKQYEGNPQQPFNSGYNPQASISGSSSRGQSGPSKPTLISAQMQIVDKNTDINRRGPGEKEGLPDGLTKNDMMQLLYTFNYTVGFHGHHEEGYTNGAKVGYYYVTGRNGVRTRIDYVADEKGFRPKISQEVLDLLSDDVPKPETEKDEKYGLKGYEFKWLYYPVDS